jgi:hypothetical protein
LIPADPDHRSCLPPITDRIPAGTLIAFPRNPDRDHPGMLIGLSRNPQAKNQAHPKQINT